jgi:hypothetical protein
MLARTVFGNTLLAWCIAAGVTALTAVVLLAARAQVRRWLAARNTPEHSRRGEWMRSVFEGTQPWFLLMVAVFIGAQFVAIPPKADRLVDHLTMVVVIAQVAFWVSRAIRHWLARQVAAKQHTDAEAATTVSVLGFFAQLALWSCCWRWKTWASTSRRSSPAWVSAAWRWRSLRRGFSVISLPR